MSQTLETDIQLYKTNVDAEDQMLMQHDEKIQQLEARLHALEILVHKIHNLAPVWWGQQ